MDVEADYFLSAVFIGVGATLVTDGWALLLRRALGIPSLSFCLVGRWLLHMPEGTFRHSSIAAARPKRSECAAGWVAHYTIGILFAFAFVAIVSKSWLENPTLVPALLFGVATVLLPFLLMQPSLGLGVAASKAPGPNQARMKSFLTHLVFGVGLYISAVVVSGVLPLHA